MEASQPTAERVIEPPKGWSLPDLRELVELPRPHLLPRQRDVRPLQAVAARRRLGRPAAAAAGGVFTVFFGSSPRCRAGRHPLPAVRVLRAWPSGCSSRSASQDSRREHRVERGPDLEGLLPAAARSRSRRCSPPLVDFASRSSWSWCDPRLRRRAEPRRSLLLPLFVALALVTALGVGLWLSALNVRYRDVAPALPFLRPGLAVRLPGRLPGRRSFPSSWQPSTRSTRWSASSRGSAGRCSAPSRPRPAGPDPLVDRARSLLVAGAVYFRRAERHFADVI